MSYKPIGYWGCDYTVDLITDIAETWGDALQHLSETDAWWLIARIAYKMWLTSEVESPPSTEAEEVVARLHELPAPQKQALLKALANS
jgi:hypothetical protein